MATPRKPKADDSELAVLQNDVAHVKDDVSDMKGVLKEMSASLAGIARIEDRQTGVVAAIERNERAHTDHDARLKVIETKAPQWDEMRAWVVRGVSAGVVMLFTGIVSVTFGIFADRIFPKAPQYLVVPPGYTAPTATP